MKRTLGIHLVLALALLIAVCPVAVLRAQGLGDEGFGNSEPVAAEPAPIEERVEAAPEPAWSAPDGGGSGITSDASYGPDDAGSADATLYPTVSAAGDWAAEEPGSVGNTSYSTVSGNDDWASEDPDSIDATSYSTVSGSGDWAGEDPDSIGATSYSTVSGNGDWAGEDADSAGATSYSTLSGDSSNWTTMGALAAPAPVIKPISREQALEALRRAGRRSADGGLTPDEIRDGCYARALDTSAVLREMGIESETAFIVAGRNGSLNVKDKDGNPVSWGWHVTPTVMVRGDDGSVQRVALDPAMSGPDATETMPMDQWVGRMIGDKAPYDTLQQGRDYAADGRTPRPGLSDRPYVTYSRDGRVFPPYSPRQPGDETYARNLADYHYRGVFPDLDGQPNPARYRWGDYNGNNVRLAAAPADESETSAPAEAVPSSELTTGGQPMAVD